MDADLFFVIGFFVALLAFPALVSAFSEGRSPRSAAILVMIGGGLIALAASRHPGGYSIADLPDAMSSVWNRYVR